VDLAIIGDDFNLSIKLGNIEKRISGFLLGERNKGNVYWQIHSCSNKLQVKPRIKLPVVY
jgi:hypothetical protein